MISPEICVVIDGRLAQDIGGEHDVEAGPGRGGAGLLDHQLGELADLGVHDIGGLHQQRAALAGPGLRPGRERGRGGFDRGLDIGQAGGGGAGRESCR